MVKEVEPGYWKGENLLFEDRGPSYKGSNTRLYKVSLNGGHLGFVKWFKQIYRFFGTDVILRDGDLFDLAEFVKDRTKEQTKSWTKKSIVDWDRVKAWEENQVTHVDD